MADTDLSVRFTGDTAALNASLMAARAALAAFAPGASGQARTSIDGLNTSMDQARTTSEGWLSSLRDIAVTTGAIVYVAKEAAVGVAGLAAGIGAATITIYGFTDGLTKIAVADIASVLRSGADGLVNFFTSAAYAERGTRLFAEANSGLRAEIGQAIIGVEQFAQRLTLAYTGIAATELAGISAAGGLDRFMTQVDRIGGAGSAKDALVGFTAELMKIPGLSQDAAGSIEVLLGALPNYSTATNDIFVSLLQTISKTGDEAVANAKRISDAFKDDKNGGHILGDLTGDLKNLEDIQILATRVAGSLQPAQASSYFDTVIAKLRSQAALQKATVDENVASLQSIPLVGSLMVRTIQDQIDKQKEFAAAVTVATANLELQKRTADAITAAQQRQVDFESVLDQDASRVGRLDEAKNNVKKLNAGAQTRTNGDAEVGEDRDVLIRTLIGEAGGEGAKGMEAVAAVIKNRVESAFDGMKTYRDVVLEGNGKQFNTWSEGNAAGASVRSIGTDDPRYRQASAIVDKLVDGKLDDPTNGATSFYNPKTATNAFPMTNATDIGNHRFGNTTGSPKVLDDDENEAKTQRLQEQADAVRKINDEKRGGTEADMASLAIAQQNAEGLHDEVAQARDLLEAKKKDLAATADGSPEARRSAENAVAEAEISLRTKVAAATKATDDLRTAQTQEGSKARLDATIAGLDAELEAAKGNEAKIAEIEKRKFEARKSYGAQEAADATEIENVKFDALQRGYTNQRALTEQNAKDGLNLGGAAVTSAAIQASFAQQEATAREHYANLASIETQYGTNSVAAVRKNAQAAAMEQDKLNQEAVAAVQKANQQIAESYRQEFERIGSTVSSSLMSIIEGTGTWRNLMQNIAKQVLQQFLDMGVKMVADWTAKQTLMIVQSVTGQSAQTSAVAAGEAARTSLVGAGAAAQAATKAETMIGSILGSAAETFAGIFGFLSPILGPAAVGPAAAGQATVAAVASSVPSFDIGAWRLPTDMVAQVHAGEMIVPAGPAAMMRAAAGGAGGSAGGKGSGTHHHTHFNVTAMDSRDVRRFFGENAKHIIGAISDGMRSGSHLGLSKLRNA